MEAKALGRPLVALESTLIAQGMPYPKNLETALALEAAVREEGAEPATLAIMDGHLKIGLAEDELTRLAKAGKDAVKTSRRDIPLMVASKGLGATTVAATMILAAMAGIRVFATGGIGGVHRGAQQSFDISADLDELAQTDVAVVCAGAKSVLDLGLTLEYLETKGVPVWGYGTDQLPAFYCRDSGLGVDARLDSPEAIAAALKAKWALGLKGGVVVANPIPAEHALDRRLVDMAIGQALVEAEKQGMGGKALTPFLLQRVTELTEGQTLAANIALVLNNARLAAKIAGALARA
ncbi:pseudouridine-5'-phosphate glycosidase [Gallaecimonas kandeliae]|nr:pseudouridine-5'-phosphate glycosidase [Gallaecimonas kandeliae]WKE67514.1 pseudouridine-5'-phosphate glycosidase [Gallaecimonas kandeliae]